MGKINGLYFTEFVLLTFPRSRRTTRIRIRTAAESHDTMPLSFESLHVEQGVGVPKRGAMV